MYILKEVNMKNFYLILVLLFIEIAFSQNKNVILKLRSFESENANVDSLIGVKAIKIANAVLNSEQFRDSIKKYDFKCENYGKKCSGKRIKSDEVLKELYKYSSYDLDLIMKNCGNEFGHSEKDKHYIQSCYKVLKRDDIKLPFEYIYAYHICHEYMHIVGFFHTDHVDDVAEKTGWIAYYILDKWFDDKIIIE